MIATELMKTTFLDISNDKCILVEFTNKKNYFDNNLLDVGYVKWLYELKEDLDKVIEKREEVEIYWSQIDVQPVSNTYKLLLKKISFIKTPVKVLETGSKYTIFIHNIYI